MRRLKLLGLALVAVFASAVALATSALALELPETLPSLGVGKTRTWTGKSIGTPEFKSEGQAPVVCAGATAEGTEESSKPPTGLFHLQLNGCETKVGGVTVKCSGLGDAGGIILILGTWHGVFDRLVGHAFTELTTGVLSLVNTVHFVCSIVLAELSGELLCLVLNPTTKSKTHEGHCIGEEKEGKVKQTEEWCRRDVGGECIEAVTPVLLRSVNHGTPGPAADLGLGSVTTTEELFGDV